MMRSTSVRSLAVCGHLLGVEFLNAGRASDAQSVDQQFKDAWRHVTVEIQSSAY